MEKMNKLEAFANSKFMTWLRDISQKLSGSPLFSAISSGMSGVIGIILLGSIVQIICAVGSLAFGWHAGDPIYDMIYMPSKLTMGILGFYMCVSLAYNYAKILKVGGPLQSAFTALICYILVAAPIVSATSGENTFDALNLGNFGTPSMFVAMIVGLISVRISKLAIDHNLIIKMPDVVPEGVISSFNSIIPAGINIIIWYGLSIAVSSISNGTLNLATMLNSILAVPISYLTSPLGMVVAIFLGQTMWFFGIHGTNIVFTTILAAYLAAVATNSELYAAGLPLAFSAVFLFRANSFVGGAGNTLPLCLMGLKSKSKQIQTVSRAAIIPGLFGINEPVIFGFPIMYNPILIIPFVLCPIVVMFFLWAGYAFGLLGLNRIYAVGCFPMGLSPFMETLDFRNALFPFLMLPICCLIYYPFFKIYEKQCLEREEKGNAGE